MPTAWIRPMHPDTLDLASDGLAQARARLEAAREALQPTVGRGWAMEAAIRDAVARLERMEAEVARIEAVVRGGRWRRGRAVPGRWMRTRQAGRGDRSASHCGLTPGDPRPGAEERARPRPPSPPWPRLHRTPRRRPAPSAGATTPLSNSPSSFNAPTKSVETAETRPRIPFGVAICTRLCRVNTETRSAPPNTARATIDSAAEREKANTTVISPNRPTARSIFTPARPQIGR